MGWWYLAPRAAWAVVSVNARGSTNRAGLRASSRGVSMYIREPFGIYYAVQDQVGTGRESSSAPVFRRPTPMGHQPLVRQSIRFRNFAAARSSSGATETVESGHINSRYAFSN